MSYIDQNKIRVFPFGNTRATDPLARTLSEYNIASIVKHITDKPSYVIKKTTEDDHIWIEFVIEGYYFKADVTDLISDDTPLYATIDLRNFEGASFLQGGDEISSIVSGEGTSKSPYILSEGSLNLTVDTQGVSKELYFEYSFTEAGTITIYKNSSFSFTVEAILINGENLKDRVSSTDTTVVVEGKENDRVRIVIQTVANLNTVLIGMDVLHANKFTAVKFFNSADDVQYEQALYKLCLLDSSHDVPDDSYIKFEGKSFGGDIGISTTIDVIYCGTATTVTGEDTPESGDNSIDKIYCGDSTTLIG